MPFEPDLPLEFLVPGIALSLGASTTSRNAWKDRIRSSAQPSLPQDHWALTVPLAVTIYLFPDGPLAGDVDNRVKPILDALSRFIYVDDRVVERVVVQKFEPDSGFPFENPSPTLLKALHSDTPVVYLRLTDDLHGELP
ncbi:MAG: RusA family crossover junction endodeoxyribonuclease [Alphaproteobacteria bacterium]